MREAITSTAFYYIVPICMQKIRSVSRNLCLKFPFQRELQMLLRDPRQRNDRIAIQRSQEGQG